MPGRNHEGKQDGREQVQRQVGRTRRAGRPGAPGAAPAWRSGPGKARLQFKRGMADRAYAAGGFAAGGVRSRGVHVRAGFIVDPQVRALTGPLAFTAERSSGTCTLPHIGGAGCTSVVAAAAQISRPTRSPGAWSAEAPPGNNITHDQQDLHRRVGLAQHNSGLDAVWASSRCHITIAAIPPRITRSRNNHERRRSSPAPARWRARATNMPTSSALSADGVHPRRPARVPPLAPGQPAVQRIRQPRPVRTPPKRPRPFAASSTSRTATGTAHSRPKVMAFGRFRTAPPRPCVARSGGINCGCVRATLSRGRLHDPDLNVIRAGYYRIRTAASQGRFPA